MSIVGIIITATTLSFIGYVALKYGFHKETARDKMINIINPNTTPIKYPKWYAILLGAGCWIAAIYTIIQIFLK